MDHCQKAGAKMEEFVRLLDEHLDYIRHEFVGDTVYIYVKSNREEPVCPYCGTPSTRKHSVYERSFQNLPLWGRKHILFWKTEKCSVRIRTARIQHLRKPLISLRRRAKKPGDCWIRL